MTAKEAGNAIPQNERLWVAVRVRPMEIFREGHRAVTVMDSQTLIFTEPASSEKADAEHAFRTGNIFQPAAGGGPNSSSRQHHRHANGSQALSNNNLSNGFPTQHQTPPRQQQYTFDRVFDETVTQEEVYKSTAAPLVRSVLEGFYATVFAYGATGSGKTYTMVGTPTNPGIMARAVDDIFHLCSNQKEDLKTEVYLSYLEVYNEQIRDLLRPSPGIHLELREDKDQVHVAGLSEIRTTSTHEVLNLLQKGNRARTMESTAANVTSSRSHAVLVVTVRQQAHRSQDILEGKLYLIDLAGSERASNTKNSGVRLREGGHINRSLLALGNCITALASGDDKYINYRDSKLTRLLKAALGGPSKTAMIAHVSPAPHQREETRNTLLYGQRARTISNRVKKFIHTPSDHASFSVIQDLRNEVKRLQMKLDQRESEPESPPLTDSPPYSMPMQTPKRVTPNNKLPDYAEFVSKHERPDLTGMKQDIMAIFEQEFRLRNDLLKLDGAMLQSALDCEILRLMVLDWENLRVAKESDGEDHSEDSDPSKTEINAVMVELKQVRQEQDKLLHLRTEVEEDLKQSRARIAQVEEEATQYLPEVQREILSLLCKLQQEQVTKMSVEIEGELKRRGALLLRCLRQKALGEAIIHRQRHFLNAISGGIASREALSSSRSGGMASPLFPPLTKPGVMSNDRLFHTPPNHNYSSATRAPGNNPSRLPRLGTSNQSGSITPAPTTTKYTDFRKLRQRHHRRHKSSSEEDITEQPEPIPPQKPGVIRKHRSKLSR